LFRGAAARKKYDNLATFYSIIKTVELLEQAYTNDAINQAEYEKAVAKLIGQHKTQETALKKAGTITSTQAFIQKYGMQCPLASGRLAIGISAVDEHTKDVDSNREGDIFAVAGLMITTLDNLKLGERSVEEVHPLVRDIVSAVKNFPELEGKQKLTNWLIDLNKMKASDEITEEQSTQLAFDVQWTFDEIQRRLTGKS